MPDLTTITTAGTTLFAAVTTLAVSAAALGILIFLVKKIRS